MARILLVDDDDVVVTQLSECLTSYGHDVRSAGNGKQGLCLLETWPVDVVITDLIMPDSEGLEFIDQLRRDHPGVRIVAISAGGVGRAAAYLQVAQSLGANATLPKPVDGNVLVTTVDQLLNG